MNKLKFLLCAVIALNVSCVLAKPNVGDVCTKHKSLTICVDGSYSGKKIYNHRVIIKNATINAEVSADALYVVDNSILKKGCNGIEVTVKSSTINGDCNVTSLVLDGENAKINGNVNAETLNCKNNASQKQITGKINVPCNNCEK